MRVHLTAVGLDRLNKTFDQAPAVANRHLVAGMTEAVALLQREVVDAMPAHTGLTRASIAAQAFAVPTGALGVVGSPSVVAAVAEFGSRPHMPPVDALEGWVRDKLGVSPQEARRVAFMVARKIAKHGTPAKKVFAQTLARLEAPIGRIFENAAASMAAELNRGGAA